MSPAVARTSPALAGRRRSSNRQARCKLFFEPRRHSAFWGGYPMSDEEARPRGWAGGPRALPCERLGQGSNPASLVPKLLPLEHRFRDHTSGQGPVGELLHRLDGLPGHEAAEEQRVFLKTECASAIPFTDSWGAPPPPASSRSWQAEAGRSRGRRWGPCVGELPRPVHQRRSETTGARRELTATNTNSWKPLGCRPFSRCGPATPKSLTGPSASRVPGLQNAGS